MKTKKLRQNKRWTKEEDTILRDDWSRMRLKHKGDKFDGIVSAKLQRTKASICWRRHELGLTQKVIVRPAVVLSSNLVNIDMSRFTKETISIDFRYDKHNERIVQEMIMSMMDQMRIAFTKAAPGTVVIEKE